MPVSAVIKSMSLHSLVDGRPNFFIVGAQKAGTSRLHYLLGKHPDVFVSSEKEPFFFSLPAPSKQQIAAYAALFQGDDVAAVAGESSTGYSRERLLPGTARRIHDFNPQSKIIYIVRHPLRCLESSWMQYRSTGHTISADFCRAVRENDLGIVEHTLYWRQISEYRRYFPDSQIQTLFFESFIADEAATLRQCFAFLGVDSAAAIDYSDHESQHSSLHKTVAHPLIQTLDAQRQSALYRRVVALFPGALKRKLRAAKRQPIGAKPTWDQATRRWAVEYLREDTEQFLSYANQPANYWDWN